MNETTRYYAPAYQNQHGETVTVGDECSDLSSIEEYVTQCNRDDPEVEFFVAYQDVPPWKRLEPSAGT
ncbi:hypothetical protein OE265_21050 [Mycobacteroides abscessus]|uniref:hypothetical protein n=1 Tax=Mycobacteroides abscessus TaxID=36809 RepID=UPI00031C9B89|nr:hypothetical protein [Mycobacteroides abscessus]MCU8693984.1 hypothetical protein [Mycobacteroides abscessus]MCU8713192.1 hypothetical protein [Mycobacteroides abscessus]MCU8717937.1 hypothetical protein [Mycobacteroides abscessus]MCU8752255.1 hypothetical protein [Mycobacteroides abscessus]MCU8761555.1 hypothetical protein [Mycobacteroides abscessus]